MKKLIMAVAVILAGASMVCASGIYATTKVGKVGGIVSGRNYLQTVTLTNPATDYVSYVIFNTTDTAGKGDNKQRIMTVILPTKGTDTFPINKTMSAGAFCVGISTDSTGGTFYDGGVDHSIYLYYDAQ
jgi:hypothetical protein